MAMATDKKLYVAVGVLVLLGAAVFFKQKADTREAATYSLEGQQQKLPELKVSDEDVKKIDKLEITQPPGDAGKGENVVLTKKGEDDWRVTEPGDYKANTSNDVYADSAYRSAETERHLKARGFRSRIHKRGRRNRPLTEAEAAANTTKSKVRARIEHVFGAQENAPGGRLMRTIGIVRAEVKIGLQNLVYNIRRLVILERTAAA